MEGTKSDLQHSRIVEIVCVANRSADLCYDVVKDGIEEALHLLTVMIMLDATNT